VEAGVGQPSFHAFTFEAYLNHVDSEEIEFWEEIERIPYRKKLSVLSKHMKFRVDPRPNHSKQFGLCSICEIAWRMEGRMRSRTSSRLGKTLRTILRGAFSLGSG
jgi:hypothetical protein